MDRVKGEKEAIFEEVQNLTKYGKENNVLIEDYVMDIRGLERKNGELEEEVEAVHKKIESMKEYHSKEIRLITSQARQFVRDVNDYGVTGGGKDGSGQGHNKSGTLDLKSFRFDLGDTNLEINPAMNEYAQDTPEDLTSGKGQRSKSKRRSTGYGVGGHSVSSNPNARKIGSEKLKESSGVLVPTLQTENVVSGPGYENLRSEKGDFVLISRNEDKIKDFNILMLKELNLTSTTVLNLVSREITALLKKDSVYIQPFIQKADRREGTEFKYYIQVILKSLEEKDLRIKELITSEQELATMVLEYQKIFKCYEDLRRNTNQYCRNFSEKISADTTDVLSMCKGVTTEKLDTANWVKEKIETRYLTNIDSASKNMKKIICDMEAYTNQFEEFFSEAEPSMQGEISELKTLVQKFSDPSTENDNFVSVIDETQWDVKLDEIETGFSKKIGILVRSWDSVKAVLSLGIMRLRQGKRSGDLEIQKLKNLKDEDAGALEKEFIGKLSDGEMVTAELRNQIISKDQLVSERDGEIGFLLQEIENIKISLEDTYRTIDGLEGNIFAVKIGSNLWVRNFGGQRR